MEVFEIVQPILALITGTEDTTDSSGGSVLEVAETFLTSTGTEEATDSTGGPDPGTDGSGKNDASAQVLKAAEKGLKVIPGMGEVIKNIDRPGNAFTTDNLARAEWSIFDVEAKGPSAGTKVSEEYLTVGGFAKAELGSASASAGAVKATVGLSADTGASISPTQVEAKVLGTGVSFGRTMGVSLFGTGVEFKLW